jgi:hypothetical protein
MIQSITSKIKFIGALLSFLIVAIVAITITINHTSKQDSVVINISGKQRMLSQKMSKEFFMQIHEGRHDFHELNISMSEFETTLNDLLDGNEARHIYAPPRACIHERLTQVNAIWSIFKEKISAAIILLQESAYLKERVQQENLELLELSDRVVKTMVMQQYSLTDIDDAGRQRMLTQKMALFMSQFLLSGELSHFTKYHDAHALYDATLKTFMQNPQPEVASLLQENSLLWQSYSRHALKVMSNQKSLHELIAYIKDANMALMQTMDSAVEAYSTYSESQRSFLQYFQYVASLIALIAMLYSARLIWQIEHQFKSFLDNSKALANVINKDEPAMPPLFESKDELTQASIHMSEFVLKMQTVLQHAQHAIHESEQAANALAGMNVNIDQNLNALDIDEASRRDIDMTIDRSEDIVIQSLEELSGTSKLLQQLQNNLNIIISKTSKLQ